MQNSSNHSSKIRFLIFILSVATISIILGTTETLSIFSDASKIQNLFREHGAEVFLPLTGIGAVATAFGFPRLALSACAGLALGLELGFLFAWISTTLGALLGYYYARILGQEYVRSKLPARIKKIEAVLLQKPLVVSMAVRNLPVGNNTLMNMLAGVSSIPTIPFVVGSSIGYLPLTFLSALFGSGVQKSQPYVIAGSLIAFFATTTVLAYLFRGIKESTSSLDLETAN